MKRRKLQSKQVEGEWLIESMEGRSYPFLGKPKAVERQLAALREDLLGRVEALRGQANSNGSGRMSLLCLGDEPNLKP